MKKAFLMFFACSLFLGGAFWFSWPDHYVHLVFCDVGQGDAILIWQGFTQVLIDAGRPDNRVLECVAEHLPFWDRQLELAVATHADSDHIGGFSAVMDRYAVNYLLVEPIGKKTGDFLQFHEVVSRKISHESHLLMPTVGQQLVVGQSLTLVTLSPQVKSQSHSLTEGSSPEIQLWDSALVSEQSEIGYNDRSIVLLARIGEMDVLLTGDLEYEGEQALINQGLLSKIEVLKVGHHGSKTSTSEPFLNTIRPEVAVISSGKDNKYGHPVPEVMEKLKQSGAQILRTDELGSVHLVTNGETLWRK